MINTNEWELDEATMNARFLLRDLHCGCLVISPILTTYSWHISQYTVMSFASIEVCVRETKLGMDTMRNQISRFCHQALNP